MKKITRDSRVLLVGCGLSIYSKIYSGGAGVTLVVLKHCQNEIALVYSIESFGRFVRRSL